MALLIARLLAPEAFGSFALALAAWITLLGLNRAALVHPFVVEAAAQDMPQLARERARRGAARCWWPGSAAGS